MNKNLVFPNVLDLYNIPHVDGGRDPKIALDCWGCFWEVFNRIGIELPRYDHVKPDPNNKRSYFEVAKEIERETKNIWIPVEPGTERTLDGMIIKWKKRPVHVAVIVKPGLMFHAHPDYVVTPEKYRTTKWKNLIEGFFRHPELA